jgi:hypothetical protein
MVMVSTTLASELESMTPESNENVVIDRFASAWETYFYDASVGGIPANGGTLAGATSAMKSAMVGITQPNAGSISIQNGIIAFWGVVASSAASIWTTVPPCTGATPPPSLATISSVLDGVFASNVASKLSLADACSAIASSLHTLNLGGICAIPSPGAPTPIL